MRACRLVLDLGDAREQEHRAGRPGGLDPGDPLVDLGQRGRVVRLGRPCRARAVQQRPRAEDGQRAPGAPGAQVVDGGDVRGVRRHPPRQIRPADGPAAPGRRHTSAGVQHGLREQPEPGVVEQLGVGRHERPPAVDHRAAALGGLADERRAPGRPLGRLGAAGAVAGGQLEPAVGGAGAGPGAAHRQHARGRPLGQPPDRGGPLLGDVGPAESRDAQHEHVALRRPRFRRLRGHRGEERGAHAEGRDQPDPPADPGADAAHRNPARAAA